MNIQIFGSNKCQNSKKAERFFKERKIKFQLIDLPKFGMSKGEYTKVKQSVGGFDKLVNENAKGFDDSFIKYLASIEAKEEKLLENPSLFNTPIVRNGAKATVGYCPEIWQEWILTDK